MGRGFGRGAKSVAVVTHAQVKNAKKVPRGLKVTRKKRRRMYKQDHDSEDPNSMMDTGDNNKGGKPKGQQKKGNIQAKTVEQQIAGIDFKQHVGRGTKLSVLRKQIVGTVKNIRRRNHQKQEARAKAEVKNVEKRLKWQKRQDERKTAAAQAGKKNPASK